MIETTNLKDWWDIVKQRYSLKETVLNESEVAFTILRVRGNQNVILARYDRLKSRGVVFEYNGDK